MNKRILLIDNYDSFTYNLYQYFVTANAEVIVRYNDQITAEEALAIDPSHVVISPGPGRPEDAGVSIDVIRTFHKNRPVLGVCLGHQCIGEMFGGRILRAPKLMHGKTSPVIHDDQGLFSGLRNPFDATRYHSLVVAEEDLPASLQISARTPEGEIMGLRVRGTLTEGVQFHPESYMTPEGERLLKNFLEFK